MLTTHKNIELSVYDHLDKAATHFIRTFIFIDNGVKSIIKSEEIYNQTTSFFFNSNSLNAVGFITGLYNIKNISDLNTQYHKVYKTIVQIKAAYSLFNEITKFPEKITEDFISASNELGSAVYELGTAFNMVAKPFLTAPHVQDGIENQLLNAHYSTVTDINSAEMHLSGNIGINLYE